MKTVNLFLLTWLCGAAGAQVLAPNVAIPFYAPPAFMQGLHRHWYAPRSAAFAAEAAGLQRAIDQLCATAGDAPLQPARRAWQSSAAAWDTLAAVAVGPLLQRRSLRQIDFTPARPELITRAILAQPAGSKDMERIGTPAKGLPALEWLLWTQPVKAGTPACAYASQVAQEIDAEAQALARSFGELAARDWPGEEEAAASAMGEVLNQWVGGLERLRWARMEKPLKSAAGRTPDFPRAASGSTGQSWAAQWQGLQALAAAQTNVAPEPGAALVTLESYLRGRGLNALATRLATATAEIGRQLQNPAPTDTARTLAATRSLSSLKRLTEAEIAPALEVNIGFSDADGD